MAQIKPLEQAPEPVGMTRLWELAFLFDLVQTASADVEDEVGTGWLRGLPVALDEKVIVRWDNWGAVETTWEVFTRYWSDFCYPASDDVAIYPHTDKWLMVYHHEERFAWGRRIKTV